MRVGRSFAGVLVLTLLVLLGSTGAGAAREPSKPPRGERAVPGELIVVFRPGVSAGRREQALAAAGVRQKRVLTRDGRVALAAGASEQARKRLGSDPRVAYVEPNLVVQALQTPGDPSFGQLWGLVNTGQTVDGATGTSDADIDADAAWDVSTGSASVAVGVIDTGVDFSHPDLAGVSWINPGEDCSGCRTNGVDDDGNGYVDDWRGWDFFSDDNDPFDDHGHGTHVAGTIAAVGDNGAGIAGVNWTARVAALKFLDSFGSGTLADAIRAIDYATQNGIRITNNSWGGSGFSQALLDAIERAGDAGGLLVAAAGNDGVDADKLPMYPAAYASPAIVSVAATDSADGLASFSNWGKTSVDLGAPGVSIYSTLPGGGYDWWSGTSMATPHVAGAAALVKAAAPQATAMATKALLLRSVDSKASLAETATGGRLNVGTAVTCAGEPKVWLDEPAAGFEAIAGEPLRIVVLAAACADPAGATVTASANGTAVALTGRGDGLYTGTYTPTATGALTVEATAEVSAATDTRSAAGTVVQDYVLSDDPYAWVDATSGGTSTGLKDDDASVTVSLPFAFELYEEAFSSVKISTNGYLVFGGSDAMYWDNDPEFPSAYQPNGIVAPFWDDLRLSSRGEIWYRTIGTSPNRRFVVSWIGAPHYFDVGDSSFQAILHEGSGDVVFQYQDVVFGEPAYDHGASATIGLESADGFRGRAFSVNDASLGGYERAKAIRFSYSPSEPDATPPAVPTGLTAAGGELNVSLDWADNTESDLAGYRVYRDGASIATTTSSAYTDAAVTAGTTYAYSVTAVDASGNESGPSNGASATPTDDTTPPAAPTALAAEGGDAQVALDWADNAESDVVGYRVYRDGARVAETAASAYADTGLANGVTYTYRVTAVDGAGNESGPSGEASATTSAVRTETHRPSSYSITMGQHYSGSLSSLHVDDGDRFQVRSRKRSGWHWAEFYASTTVDPAVRSTLSRLTIDAQANATSSNAWIDLLVYDWTSGGWEWLEGEFASTSDRSFSWTAAEPARYVSPTGEIRFMVAADNDRAFRSRTDLISFTIEY